MGVVFAKKRSFSLHSVISIVIHREFSANCNKNFFISSINVRLSISAYDQISEFQAWQKTWRETNLEDIEMKRKLGKMEEEKKHLEAEEKIKTDMVEAVRATIPTRPAVRSI